MSRVVVEPRDGVFVVEHAGVEVARADDYEAASEEAKRLAKKYGSELVRDNGRRVVWSRPTPWRAA